MDVDPRLIEKVKGFLDPDEGMALYEYALAAGRFGPCLEVGSYCGKSALYLGAACRRNHSILFSVDHHRGSEEQQPGQSFFDPDLLDRRTGCIDTFGYFRHTLKEARLEDTVVPVVGRSETVARAWATPLSLVFIDGGHGLETVFSDYCAWATHVMPGGFLIFHDIFKDPAQGGQAPYRVFETAAGSGLFRRLPMVKTLGVLVRLKTDEAPEYMIDIQEEKD